MTATGHVIARGAAHRLRMPLAAWAAAAAADNVGRTVLWLPVLFGCGTGLYFALPSEPAAWIVAAPLACFTGLLVARRRSRGMAFVAALCGAAACAGFVAAQVRTAVVAAPVLEREIGPVPVVGRVVHAEIGLRSARLLLDRLDVGRLAPEATPDRVRLSVRLPAGAPEAPVAGDVVRVLAVLQPPPQPSLPGGFDFARAAWFEGIGGVGYALGAPRIEKVATRRSWGQAVARLRQDLTGRILALAGPAIGPVAAALMTGERRAIPEDTLAAMRDSGLAHLLAISGLHIGLVAGLLFFAVRFGLASVERLALRLPIKKIAAVAALVGACAYLVISGATVPTQRAFLMTGIVLFAVLIDRTAISMRLVALAAVCVLAMAPESLLGPSFQMSFAAVVALVAVYEAAAPTLSRWRRGGGLPGGRIGAFVGATLLTSLVAGLATAPFAAYHFNRLALLGLLANMVAVPLMAVWIMPCAIVGLLLMPFGLEAAGLVPMGWGIEIVLWVARSVAALPGAAFLVPPLPVAGLVLIVLGGLWLCLWRGRVRLLGLPAVAFGAATALFVAPPDLIVARDGDLVAVSLVDGGVALSPGRGRKFERDMWLRRLAVPTADSLPDEGIAHGGAVGCDDAGCIALVRGRTVALVRGTDAAAEDCGRVDYVVLLERIPVRACRGSEILADGFRLWRDGAHAIRFTGSGPVVETSRDIRGDRPWSRPPAVRGQYLRTRPTRRP